MTFFILDFLCVIVIFAGQIRERSDGVLTNLAGMIFIIRIWVYLLKLNICCRKNNDADGRKMKDGFLIGGVNIISLKVPVQARAEPVLFNV
ncbi:hypothetical protein HWQ17_02165 [Enterobacter pasteurii]|uniref:hypothetical protein n=1 Tax=Enterobacter pasteurii TaxID=3029761 RepID=UPI0011DDDD39|nr:hypothetical protein [Enterobacter pasteurii]QLA66512.1 hypothetical protein HWQ17_02165 [Enterobacter pasteurii]